jgi:hypothetical protein
MTCCIGALFTNPGSANCHPAEGIVVAADRMVSTPTIEFEHPSSRKITPIVETCAALTSGNALAHRELLMAVRDELFRLKSPSVEHIVRTIKDAYHLTRQQQIVERSLRPRAINTFADYYQLQRGLADGLQLTIQAEIENYNMNLEIMIAGMAGPKAHIFTVADPGTSWCWDSIGFVVIGSGHLLGMHQLISGQCHADLGLPDVLMQVYEGMLAASRAPGVGTLADFAIIDGSGTIEILCDKAQPLKEIAEKRKAGNNQWLDETDAFIRSLQKERNTLRRQTLLEELGVGDESNAQPSEQDAADGSGNANEVGQGSS